MVKWLVDKRWYHNLVVKLEKENKWRTSRWLMMLNIVRDELANSSIVRRINWFWWRHTHFCLLLDQTKKRVQHIVQKFSISLSLPLSLSPFFSLSLSLSLSLFLLLSSLFVIAQCSHFSPYSPGNNHDICLQTRESRRSWEKAFCSEILVPVITVRTLKIEWFLLLVSLISSLHTIFMRIITFQCYSYFCNIFLASWRESPKRLKAFDGRREIWYAISYYLVMQ